ncbi:hypothetical protein SAMN05216392_0487 [Streptococcus equinus]|uniref:Alpha/beta hydrolase n=1 Tax=Streptococcus equinus TaxID=1335 RepID=A0A1H0Y891_STREI|nr:hypothetical protein [Streptococcus equinus]SDQ11367.1 hypothetical protein SAMN05216392_0487 [Streptococcus equinus]
MYIHEFGNSAHPKIILLAPMMISGENLYHLMKPYLKGDYCIIAPDQGGHGKAGQYLSADDEYQHLKSYLEEKEYFDIKLVYGASLGVAIGWRLFNDQGFKIEHAWFDGVALKKNAWLLENVTRLLFRQKKRALKKSCAAASQSLVKLYGEDLAKLMTKNFERITSQDIDAICHACCHYNLQQLTQEQQSKLHLEYGEKDFDLGVSKKAFKKYLPEVDVIIRKGYPHCGYFASNTAAYVAELEAFIK